MGGGSKVVLNHTVSKLDLYNMLATISKYLSTTGTTSIKMPLVVFMFMRAQQS